MTRFYKQYNTAKLAHIETFVNHWKGREVELFEKLVEQYGPEPDAPKGYSEMSNEPKLKLVPPAFPATYKSFPYLNKPVILDSSELPGVERAVAH